MLDVTSWWTQFGGAERRWLILDSGPSLARRGEFDLSAYATVALGRAINEAAADVALIDDLDVVRDCGARIESSAGFLLMPLRPNQSGKPSERSLEASLDTIPVLKALNDQGRLIGYEAESPKAGGAADAVRLLGTLGARQIRTLGVDPNPAVPPTPISAEATRLADTIATAAQKFQLDFGPLTSETPARIFIGSDPTQMLGAKILEYSIRRHSTLSTVFDTMQTVKAPVPRDPQNQQRTEFSFSRFAIPSLSGYHGRALYLDADMLVFQDLRELWELPFDGATVMHAPPSNPSRPKQTSVMMMDCDRLRWDLGSIIGDLDEGRYKYDDLMQNIALEPSGDVRDSLPTVWNSLEEYVPGKTRLIHYTDMKTQPWVSRRNPHGELWVQYLRDAVRDGFVTVADVREAVQNGFIRPSLLWQLRVAPQRWPRFLKTAGPVLDIRYKPHRGLRKRLSRAKIGIS